MKIGVPGFGYTHFDHFAREVAEQGFFTANLGDNIQTIALRRLLRRLGVPDAQVVEVDRDTLAQYRGEPVALILNGVFMRWCFPTPPQVTPVFLGFCASEATIAEHRGYLAAHAPIGCRDDATAEACARHGIDAFVTGCFTLSLQPRQRTPDPGRVVVAYGAGAGAFPAAALRTLPSDLLERLDFVSQRIPRFTHPLDASERAQVERYAEGLLQRYADTASLMITPLHHAAAPCMAMGIPVVLCRERADSRFSFLERLVPLHLAPRLDSIDWHPAPVDLTAVRDDQTRLLRERLRALQPSLVP